MTVEWYQKIFGMLKPEVEYAGEYLESRFYRFGVEFGATNAVDKATTCYLDELETEEGYGAGV